MLFQPAMTPLGLARLGRRSMMARYRTFRADSSSGKWPRLRVAARNLALRDSMPFVPGMKGHESRRVLLVPGLGRAYGATVRNKGSWGNRMGRPLLLDGLRARVSSWPPLRLVRLRRERESVGVVSVQRFLAPLVEGE